MKKLFIAAFSISLLASCGNKEDNPNATEETTAETNAVETEACNADDVDAAAKCLCEMFDKEDALYEAEDPGAEAYSEKIADFNSEIDKAIDKGLYTEKDLEAAGEKIGCEW